MYADEHHINFRKLKETWKKGLLRLQQGTDSESVTVVNTS